MGRRRCSATRVGDRGRRPRRSTSATARRSRRKRVVDRPRVRLGRRPAAAHAVARDASSTRCTSRASPCAIPTCPRSCAAPTPASRTPAVIEHLQRLGVTAVELLPVHQFVDDRHLDRARPDQLLGLQHDRLLRARRALRRAATAAAARSREFKAMVQRAARGRHRGDPRRRLQPHRRGQPAGPDAVVPRHRQRRATTGSSPTTRATTWTTPARGNTLNMRHPRVLQLIMDSLRYWVAEMHVDGFRFDLARALARELHDVDRLGAFFDIIHQDPVLSQVKLIAEPWDVGEGGYQVGNFPPLWAEWNGKYRDARARLLAGRRRARSPSSRTRLTGSSDLYEHERPAAVREHQLRHRARRLHAARPGLATTRSTTRPTARTTATATSDNRSLELRRRGPDRRSGDPRAARAPEAQLPRDAAALAGRADAARRRRDRPHAAAATTTPTARTTRSPGSTGTHARPRRCSSSRARLIALRREHPVFRRRALVPGPADPRRRRQRHRLVHARRRGDVRRGLGERVRQVAGVFLNGEAIAHAGPRGERVRDDSFYLVFNAHWEPIDFILPAPPLAERWLVVLDTEQTFPEDGAILAGGSSRRAIGRSLVLLRRVG